MGCVMKKNSKNNSVGEDKRTYPRRQVFKKMTYRELVPSKEEGMIQDISEGGLCILLNKEFSPGTILEVKYELQRPTPKPIESIVKVVWQKKSEKGILTGVKFIP